MAIVPTTYLPPEALPEDWKEEPLWKFMERSSLGSWITVR